MPTDLLPDDLTDGLPGGAATTNPRAPQAVVESFLKTLADSDLAGAMEHLAEDVTYINVGLPTVRGRDQVARALGVLDRPPAGFEVYLHAISVDEECAGGPAVLTERTDVLIYGRLRMQFWVWGRFDVDPEGRITLWRDSFDGIDILRSLVRGVVGVFVPSLRPRPPRPGDPPGR